MKRKQTPRKRPAVVSLVLFLGGLALFAGLAALTASISYSAMRDAIATWKITSLGGVAVDPAPTFSPEIHGTPAPGEPTASPDGDGQATEATSIPLPTPDPWDGASRVTILVMGLDYGDWESSDRTGPPRSDTMMLLTIDPLSLTAGMLSIPRDLWVSIPGFEGNHKINTAVRFGELYQLPGGGPALAIKTVEQVVGVEIDYFALIDFYAFEKFIDEIGGVDVEVAEEIKVDPIGPHNTVILKPGLQHLDGPVALGYARNRYTADGDFDRSRRQQQVILAIRRRILSLDMLPVLVSKAPALYQEIGAGVRTNLTLEQAIQLAWLAQQIQQENIKSGVIGNKEVIYATSSDGLSIFKPIPSKIRLLRDEIFLSSVASPAAGEMNEADLIAAENARVSIVNSAGIETIANDTSQYLVSQGVNVTGASQGQAYASTTQIIDYTGNPYTLRYLVDIMGIQPNQIKIEFNPDSDVDLVITLGADWANNNPMQ